MYSFASKCSVSGLLTPSSSGGDADEVPSEEVALAVVSVCSPSTSSLLAASGTLGSSAGADILKKQDQLVLQGPMRLRVVFRESIKTSAVSG